MISIHALRGEGDHRRLPVWLVLCHFYPRPPRGGRHEVAQTVLPIISISIHALRGEGDAAVLHLLRSMTRFLSTPSAGRATRRTM